MLLRHLLVLLLLTCFSAAYAQEGNRCVWKVRQARKIKLVDKNCADTTHHAAIRAFLGNLIESARSGKIPVYTFAQSNEAPMPTGAIADILTLPMDTALLLTPYKDPATGKQLFKEEIVAKRPEFDLGWIEMVQVVEDWEYDLHTGETKMTIAYIAPLRQVYAETKEYRGLSAMFWIKWEKMAEWLDAYKGKQIAAYVYNSIWENYFKDRKEITPTTTEKRTGQTLLKRTATARVKYRNDSNVLANKIGVWGVGEEMLLSKILYDTLMVGRAKAYADMAGQPGKELNKTELKSQVTKTDTEIVVDPIDGSEVMRVKVANITNHVSSYSVIVEWALNLQAGKMSIRNLYAAPEVLQYDQDNFKKVEKALFWMQWKDVFQASGEVNSYNPEDNLEVGLWYDNFVTGSR